MCKLLIVCYVHLITPLKVKYNDCCLGWSCGLSDTVGCHLLPEQTAINMEGKCDVTLVVLYRFSGLCSKLGRGKQKSILSRLSRLPGSYHCSTFPKQYHTTQIYYSLDKTATGSNTFWNVDAAICCWANWQMRERYRCFSLYIKRELTFILTLLCGKLDE